MTPPFFAACATKCIGKHAGSPIGSSCCHTSCGTALTVVGGDRRLLVFAAELARNLRAYGRSWKFSASPKPSNPTENVRSGVRGEPAHERDVRARIEASAEEGSDRHVAHQPLGNRSFEQLANALDALGAVGWPARPHRPAATSSARCAPCRPTGSGAGARPAA